MKKVLSTVMSLVMLISVFTGLEITANAYTETFSGYNMAIGESVTITDDNMTNGTGFSKTWYSNNTSVASVSSTGQKTARVYAEGTGTCTVTCSTESWVTIYVYNAYTKRTEPQTNYKTTYHYYTIKVTEKTTTVTTTKTPNTTATQQNSASNSNSSQNTEAAQPSGNYVSANESASKLSSSKKTSIKSLKRGRKQFKATWKKVSGVSGYQLQYATNKKFKKNKKSVTVKKSKTTSKTVKKLKSNKKYYVRIRTYKTVNGKKLYSSWSKAKTVKVK